MQQKNTENLTEKCVCKSIPFQTKYETVLRGIRSILQSHDRKICRARHSWRALLRVIQLMSGVILAPAAGLTSRIQDSEAAQRCR